MNVYLTNGTYSIGFVAESDWFHLAVVYHGSEEGFTLYLDSALYGTNGYMMEGVWQQGSGKLEIGGTKYNGIEKYNSVCADELKMWNRELSEVEIRALYEED